MLHLKFLTNQISCYTRALTSNKKEGLLRENNMEDSEEIARIEKNGNKPEEWLDFLRKAKRRSNNYEYIVDLYEKAASSISPDDNRKNICYARLLVEFAKLQGMASTEDAIETFRCARCNVKRFAIVYIAWAQFELDKGNREKCRNHLLRGKINGADPHDILEIAIKSCEQGNDRLLDDETEELMFTGVITKTKPRPSISLPTVMSDSEMTTEKLLGDDNTADIPSSKSDTGVISFKLPTSTSDKTSTQRPKLSSSGSSSEETLTAPFHHIVKPNRSMSTVKPSLQVTPDCRTVGSKSISNSMNLSVRKPNCRTGIGKSFNVLMGPPLRGKPVPLHEEKETDDIMDGIKPINHSIMSHHLDENPLNNQCTINENEQLQTMSDVHSQQVVVSNVTTKNVDCNDTYRSTNQDMNQIELPAVVDNSSDSVNNPRNSSQINKPESNITSQAVIEPKPKGYTSHRAAALGDHFESIKTVDQVSPVISSVSGLSFQDRHNVSNVLNSVIPPNSTLASSGIHPNPNLASSKNHELVAPETPHPNIPRNPIHQKAEPPSVEHPLRPNSISMNPSHLINSNQNILSRNMNVDSKPFSVCSKSSNKLAQTRVPVGMEGHAGFNEKNILYMQNKNIPGNSNHCYPPPQGGAGYPNIVVNGKSYLKLGAIGRGGSSKVFRAFDGKRICAIKYVSLEDADDFIVQSYINEIDMLKRLQGSDYIIKLYDWEQKKDENSIILVLECGSIDLAAFLRKNRSTFTETELIPYWKQMLEAVNVIHNQGIIHSDLKPANFLFVEGRLKLIDFGIANSIQADQTSIQRDTQVGTLNFMSPEAFQDISGQSQMNMGRSRPCTKIGRPSDVWSLGCILYAMVYGRTPFQHITNQAMKLQCITDGNYAIEFPHISNSKLLDVLKGCLIRNPRERYTIPYLLDHPFLCKPDEAKEPNEMFFDALVELNGANFSPSSFRSATKNIFEQLRSGNKIDVSSIVAKINHQPLHGNSRPGRQPLSGLAIDTLQAQGHGAIKSSTPYMGNDKPYLDKENADIMFTG